MEPRDPTPDFLNYNELLSENNGGRVLFATDDFFAVAENLIKEDEPIWQENEYTEYGKWMDGWETRRKRSVGHDWVILKTRLPCFVKGACVDTCYFTGNFAPRFSLAAANINDDIVSLQNRDSRLGTEATNEEMENAAGIKSEAWTSLIPMHELRPGYPETRRSYFKVETDEAYNYFRFNIYPDGGVARLRLYGLVCLKLNKSLASVIDLASMENGAACLEYSDAHYGHPRNLIKPGRGSSMADGWETARRIDRPAVVRVNDKNIVQVPGEEWAVFKLACAGVIERITVDTSHFKGNYPDNVRLEAARVTGSLRKADWRIVLRTQKLSPHTEHEFTVDSRDLVDHVRVVIAPDGGFSRLRVWGRTINEILEASPRKDDQRNLHLAC